MIWTVERGEIRNLIELRWVVWKRSGKVQGKLFISLKGQIKDFIVFDNAFWKVIENQMLSHIKVNVMYDYKSFYVQIVFVKYTKVPRQIPEYATDYYLADFYYYTGCLREQYTSLLFHLMIGHSRFR